MAILLVIILKPNFKLTGWA